MCVCVCVCVRVCEGCGFYLFFDDATVRVFCLEKELEVAMTIKH